MTVATPDNIDSRVAFAFTHHPHLDMNRLRFKSRDGRVTLHGKVDSYFEKQMAQEALRHVDGVSEIENHLTVCCS